MNGAGCQSVFLTGSVASQSLHDQAVAAVRGTADVQAVVHSGLIVQG